MDLIREWFAWELIDNKEGASVQVVVVEEMIEDRECAIKRMLINQLEHLQEGIGAWIAALYCSQTR